MALGLVAVVLLLGLGLWRFMTPAGPATPTDASAASDASSTVGAGRSSDASTTTPAASTSASAAETTGSSSAVLLTPGSRVEVTPQVIGKLPFPVEGQLTATVVEIDRSRGVGLFRVEKFSARLQTVKVRPPVYLTLAPGSTITLTIAKELARESDTWSRLGPERTVTGIVRLSSSQGGSGIELISFSSGEGKP
jgi:hypothetical protein